MIRACYAIDKKALRWANPQIIAALITKGDIEPEVAVEVLKRNEQIILASYARDPNTLHAADQSLLIKLIQQKKIPATLLQNCTPFSASIIWACYLEDNSLRGYIRPEIIRNLIKIQVVTPQQALDFFPEDNDICRWCYDTYPELLASVSISRIAELIKMHAISTSTAIKIISYGEVYYSCKLCSESLLYN